MKYDLFISHSSKDKERYILPLCQTLEQTKVKYWLDSIEIEWGDNIVDKINRGISECQYMLICLSDNFLSSNWTNSEFTATYAIQNNEGRKKVLPLIINSKDKVLEKYPLLSSINYKEFSSGLNSISDSLAQLIHPLAKLDENSIKVFVESKYSGKSFEFNVPHTASFKFLRDRIINVIGLSDSVDIGTNSFYNIRWVLVDSRADKDWKRLNRYEQGDIVALVKDNSGILKITDDYDKLQSSGITDSTMFYLYAVEDRDYAPPCYSIG